MMSFPMIPWMKKAQTDENGRLVGSRVRVVESRVRWWASGLAGCTEVTSLPSSSSLTETRKRLERVRESEREEVGWLRG